MRNFLLSLGLTCTLGMTAAYAQTPAWQWGAQSVNPTPTNQTEARAYAIATDAAGNSYVGVGMQARNSVTSVRNFGSTTLSTTDIGGVVAKLNAAGQWQWATPIESQDASGTTYVFISNVVTTAAGEVFVAGTVDESATSMRVGTVTLNLASTSLEERMFVARLNSSGQCTWLIAVNGASAHDMALNPVNGELLLTGGYYGGASFGSTALPAPLGTGDTGMYVARLSQAGQWTSALGVRASAAGAEVSGDDVSVGAQGQVAVAVYVEDGSVTLGGATINASSVDKMAVAQLTPAGQWQWVVQAPGASTLDVNALQYDASGNLWVLNDGNAGGQLGTVTLPANTVGFVGRLSSAGAWNLAGSIASQTGRFYSGNKLAVDAQGNAVVAGELDGATTSPASTYSFGAQTLSFTTPGLYVARFNAAGQWQYAIKSPTGTANGATPSRYSFNAIALDAAGSLLTLGNLFSTNVTFGPNTLVGSTRDIFVAKLTNAGTTLGVRQAAGAQPLALYPNPVAGGATATLRLAAPAASTQAVTLRNTLGQLVRQTSLAAGRQEVSLPTAGLTPGVYLLEAGLSRAQIVVQ
ncbi:T9SS type A sorting domain-containing protein [Hymenobacter sp. BT635]|uniref:T9SS type A sorting domain-containing protein n=1 Tax=Hymenobacter nitidus TaxID=2880929 RepID=A0ABS8AAU1_9BACT|nr:T9SS type A sorting domain-containing protein [Hymenobacter nitidus]MCB2377523.1 T9SS type A sorting domain-containing protein [Hymenobacter nitidus]